MAGPSNGSIHGMSLLVGELKGTIEHLNNNIKMKDAEAMRAREHLTGKLQELKDMIFGVKNDVHKVDGKVEDVQQDVAEIKNDMADANVKIDNIERKEQRLLGSWDVIKRLGTGARVVLGAIIAGAVTLAAYWLKAVFGW